MISTNSLRLQALRKTIMLGLANEYSPCDTRLYITHYKGNVLNEPFPEQPPAPWRVSKFCIPDFEVEPQFL